MKNIIGYLLNAANSDPWFKQIFYPIKSIILKQFGKRIAWDQQHIFKECWSCDGSGIFRGFDNGLFYREVPPQMCTKCFGSGRFDEFWVLLEVWFLGGFEFHIPIERVRKLEYFSFKYSTPTFPGDIRNYIEGYITHKSHPIAEISFWILTFFYARSWFFREWKRILTNKIKRPYRALKNKLNSRKYQDDEIPF